MVNICTKFRRKCVKSTFSSDKINATFFKVTTLLVYIPWCIYVSNLQILCQICVYQCVCGADLCCNTIEDHHEVCGKKRAQCDYHFPFSGLKTTLEFRFPPSPPQKKKKKNQHTRGP